MPSKTTNPDNRRRLTKDEVAKGYELVRILVRYAYPRSGNCYSPTPEYRWELRQNGRYVGSCSRARDAIAIIYETFED